MRAMDAIPKLGYPHEDVVNSKTKKKKGEEAAAWNDSAAML